MPVPQSHLAEIVRIVATACLVAAVSAAVAAEDGPEATEPSRAPSLAEQEAEAQAFAVLYTRLGQLQLTPDVRVRDFLASGAAIRAFAWDGIRRHARVDRPQRYSDGAVAVQVHIPIREVVAQLKSVCRADCSGETFKPEDFDKILLYTDRRALWGFGESLGRPRLALADPAPVGWYDVGVFGRLRARRLATENAQERLFRRIGELRFSPSKRVGEFITSDKRIAADMAVFVRSRPVPGQPRYLLQRICEVDVGIAVADLVAELKSLANAYAKGTEFTADKLEGLVSYAGDPVVRATGVAVPSASDARGTAPGEQELWTCSAEAEAPENVKDADQAALLATRAALARCREKFRSRLLWEPAPAPPGGGGEAKGRTVADWVTAEPDVREDLDTLLGNLRLVQARPLKGGRVKVTAELPVTRIRNLLSHLVARRKPAGGGP